MKRGLNLAGRICSGVVLATFVCVGATPAATFTVTKTDDTNDGVCDEDCSLREAVIAANASPGPAEVTVPLDVVGFPPWESFTLTLEGTDEDAAATGDLDITGDLTLNKETGLPFIGAVIIDGNATDRVFHIHPGATATIYGVTIQNGSANEGGGILNAGTLSLTGSIVTDNASLADGDGGGGIFNSAGVVTLTNSTVSGNLAESNHGGGIFNDAGVVTLTDSTVSTNSADNLGGGIASFGTLTLANSTVTGNSARSAGGILNAGSATLITSTLSANSAENSGGGIVNDGTLTLTDSGVSVNTAEMENGGGIYNDEGGTLTLTNSTVSGNTAEMEGGGGIYNDEGGTLTLTNSTVSGNSAHTGGGILNYSTAALTNCTLGGNSAAGRGGGIFNDDGVLTLTNTVVAGSASGRGCVNRGGTITSAGHNLDEDGTCGLNAEGDLSNVDAHLAPLGDYGGPTETHALCTGEGVPDPSCTAASLAIDAADNDACPDTDQRGAERPQPFDGACDIGAYEANSPLSVTKGNDTNDGACDADCSLREAIEAANAFPGADAVIVPARIYLLTLGELGITGDLTLMGAGAETTVIDGNATGSVFANSASTSISGVTIQNGLADKGGGIVNYGTLTLTDSTVSDNTADGSFGGGGIFNDGNLTVTDSTVHGNNASSSLGGGGILNFGTAELTNSTVSDNSIDGFGGGIANVHLLGPGHLTLRNTTLSGNSAIVGGGIINAGSAELTNSTVSDNSAEIRGGGIENEGTVTVTSTTLTGNSAGTGGGIHNRFGQLSLTSSIIANSPSGNDCVANEPITSDGHNLDTDGSCELTGPGDLSNVDPHLAPLGSYGGPTPTHALCTGPGEPDASCTAASPALDAGDDEACPATDQRGVERPQPAGGVCDIGAYEVSECGNGVLDPDEQCDDGNLDDGDGCSSACEIERPCAQAADRECRTASKALLMLKQKGDGTRDKLVWKLSKAQATSQEDFADPTESTDYVLCLKSDGSLVADCGVPASSSRWQGIGTRAYRYNDKSAPGDGIQTILLKGSDRNKTKVLVKGKGANLPDPTLPLELPVTVRLVNSDTGMCWESTFDEGDVIKNEEGQFKAKASN